MEAGAEERYIESLPAREKRVLEIARESLGSSFSLGRSHGFLAWMEEQKKSGVVSEAARDEEPPPLAGP